MTTPGVLWINGTHGVGKTTTAALLLPLIPGSHVLDAEKVGETLMDVRPALPDLANFQHWPPWRPLVVETARRLLEYTGGMLIMPMTVLVEAYWREIAAGLDAHGVPVRHVVLHADEDVLRDRIARAHDLPSPFRLAHVGPYTTAAASWLHAEAEVVDTTSSSPEAVAQRIAGSRPASASR